MATSTIPIVAPNTIRAKAMPPVEFISVSNGRSRHRSAEATKITVLHRNRPVRKPVSGIERVEPAPIHSSNSPNVPSLISRRSFTKGTRGAQRSEEHTSELQSHHDL